MLPARAITRATATKYTADCNSMIIQRVGGEMSVGLTAVALVNDTFR